MKKLLQNLKTSIIYGAYEKEKIQEKKVFAESRNGKEIAGNILRIIIEIKRQYGQSYEIVVATEKRAKARIRQMLDRYDLSWVRIVDYGSIKYYKEIASSRYLINDVTFPDRLIKKDGQVYLNTWHGTPYKHMGFDDYADRGRLSNIQRNLLLADILLMPSQYCEDIMLESFCIKDILPGKILRMGYPRNTVFFDKALRVAVRDSFELNDKFVLAYMPTYRQNKGEQDSIWTILEQFDSLLTDAEVLYVKLHNLSSVPSLLMSRQSYRHIRPFPSNIETYEFLTATDCLISDYSSVIYDYAVFSSNIALFDYDYFEYKESRGLYEQPIEFPFPHYTNVPNMLQGVRNRRTERDIHAFRNIFCKSSHIDSTQDVVKTLIKDYKAESKKDSEFNHNQLNCVYIDDTVNISKEELMNRLEHYKADYCAVNNSTAYKYSLYNSKYSHSLIEINEAPPVTLGTWILSAIGFYVKISREINRSAWLKRFNSIEHIGNKKNIINAAIIQKKQYCKTM